MFTERKNSAFMQQICLDKHLNELTKNRILESSLLEMLSKEVTLKEGSRGRLWLRTMQMLRAELWAQLHGCCVALRLCSLLWLSSPYTVKWKEKYLPHRITQKTRWHGACRTLGMEYETWGELKQLLLLL